MLSLQEIHKRFGARVLLSGLDLDVADGELIAIVGESGAGKSTLLNLIAGLDSVDAGRIVLAGQDLGELDDEQRTRLRRSHIGFVFQAFHVLPHLTVAQNVLLPLVLLGVQAEQPDVAAARVAAMLAAVDLGHRAQAATSELSGGELQRVALARALVHKPRLVLADEPTGNLDPDSARAALDLLAAAARREGAAGIIVTHSPPATAACDRTLRLAHGRLLDSRLVAS